MNAMKRAAIAISLLTLGACATNPSLPPSDPNFRGQPTSGMFAHAQAEVARVYPISITSAQPVEIRIASQDEMLAEGAHGNAVLQRARNRLIAWFRSDWTDWSDLERASKVVHEAAHSMQRNMTNECREAEAFAIQAAWLRDRGAEGLAVKAETMGTQQGCET